MIRTLSLVRLTALVGGAVCFVHLAANILQTWDTFDPSYWGYYVQQQLARPLVGLAISAIGLMAARPLARWLSRGCDE